MTLPDVHFEVYYDDAWNEHIQDVAFESSALTVTYGQQDEHGEAEPTTIDATLDNRDNDWSPKDPRSSKWGKIGQGTKCRVRVGDSATEGLYVPGVKGARASTPDASALDISGDIDVRIDLHPSTWRPNLSHPLICRWWNPFEDNRGWIFYLLTDGTLRFRWTTDGTLGTTEFATSTAAIPEASGRLAVRVTLDVNNGAGGNTATFYTASTLSGSWTQLGLQTVSAGTTSIFTGSLDLAIGTDSNGDTGFNDAGLGTMTVYGAQVRSGIGGTIVANPDFTSLTSTDTEFTDSASREWTLHTGVGVVDTSVRGTAAIPDWKPQWDETGYAAEMKIRAAGILEQLGHGKEPLRSSLYRDLFVRENIVGYWPLEEAEGATSFAGGKPGIPPARPIGSVVAGGEANFSSVASTVTIGSEAGLSGIVADVPAYTPTDRQRLIVLVEGPENGTPAEALLMDWRCTGSVRRIAINIDTNGDLTLFMFDVDGNTILDSGTGTFDLNGNPKALSLLLTQDGSDIDWQLGAFIEGDGSIGAISGTVTGETYGRFLSASCGASSNLGGTKFCHMAVINNDMDGDIWDILFDALPAWAGERALDRQNRLCEELGIPFMAIGPGVGSERMGPQGIATFLDLFGECADAELGPAGERRDAYALLARAREDLYNQDPALTLDLADGVVINPFEAPLDTQSVRNDVTVTRKGGSSYRAVKTSGALSTADPPEGLGGSYPADPQLNIESDERLRDQATWRLWLGTTDQHRMPKIEIEMEHHTDLVDEVLALRRGDIILIQNAGDLYGLPPGDLRLMFLGSSDVFTDQTWHVTLNCAPGDPWTVGTFSDGTDEQRFDTDGSTVQSTNFVAGTSTSLSVATTLGPLWTTDDTEVPFDINADGAILTVTDISGSSSPQTFTVSTTVKNGVERLLPQGSDVRLANPTIVGL